MYGDGRRRYPRGEGTNLAMGLDATLVVGTVAADLARLVLVRSATTVDVGTVHLRRRC